MTSQITQGMFSAKHCQIFHGQQSITAICSICNEMFNLIIYLLSSPMDKECYFHKSVSGEKPERKKLQKNEAKVHNVNGSAKFSKSSSLENWSSLCKLRSKLSFAAKENKRETISMEMFQLS